MPPKVKLSPKAAVEGLLKRAQAVSQSLPRSTKAKGVLERAAAKRAAPPKAAAVSGKAQKSKKESAPRAKKELLARKVAVKKCPECFLEVGVWPFCGKSGEPHVEFEVLKSAQREEVASSAGVTSNGNGNADSTAAS